MSSLELALGSTVFLGAGDWGLGTGEVESKVSPAPSPQPPNTLHGIGLQNPSLYYQANFLR